MKYKFQIIPATLEDYPTIQNMARFYVYDISRSCGFISHDWALPSDGVYECYDLKKYFEEEARKAFLIRASGELAGFVLLNQVCTEKRTNWNMEEFFILAKFQGKGMGRAVAHDIWTMYPGIWEVSIIPENKPAYGFWEKTINAHTAGKYKVETKQTYFL